MVTPEDLCGNSELTSLIALFTLSTSSNDAYRMPEAYRQEQHGSLKVLCFGGKNESMFARLPRTLPSWMAMNSNGICLKCTPSIRRRSRGDTANMY